MKPTYLVHDRHGVHIVYDSADLERHLKVGWKVREERRPVEPVEPIKRGPGRPRKAS